MENTPVVLLGGHAIRLEDREKYLKWRADAYIPLYKRVQGVKGVDLYVPVRERPEYPQVVTLHHYENMSVREAVPRSREWSDIQKDSATTFPSIRYLWNYPHQLIRSFRNDPSLGRGNEDTRINNAPIMHLEAYRLTADEEKIYFTWLTKWGFAMYIPILMRLPGLKGYDCYQWSGVMPILPVMDTEVPQYLSILYFENIGSYENYEKSPELAAVRRAINSDFPKALIMKWYVQYQHYAGWRK